MRNVLTFKHWLSKLFSSKNQVVQSSSWLIPVLLTLSLTGAWNRVQAATPETAPPQLKNLLGQIDAAATQGNVKAVMQFYSPNFTNSDGLTRQSMEKALNQLWQRYPDLKYQTQLQSWKAEGNAIVAETITNITGTASPNSNRLALNATITSRQRYQNQKIVQQEILAERSQLSSGVKPPTVEIKLPTQIKVGQQYNFDAIVKEPLGDDYLLGAAVEEPIQLDKYFNPTTVNLELLPAGGLFKIGRAPNKADNRWVSAVVVRGDGITMITQRLQVLSGSRSLIQPSGNRR